MSKYKDQYGDIWVRIDEWSVKRLKDGCIGAWRDGKGLIEV